MNARRFHGSQSGATLIELAIGVTIAAILLGAGMPSFAEWIQNTRIRTAAELVQNGMQAARTEAIRRNANVRFTLTDVSGTTGWTIGCVTVTTNCEAAIKTQVAGEGSGNARVGVMTTADIGATAALAAGAGLPATVTFNSLGRVVPGTNITRADVIHAGASEARRMVIAVSSGGQIRMCDPKRAAGDPQAC
jgi:type IV fimbrial biogenesis protein FimT